MAIRRLFAILPQDGNLIDTGVGHAQINGPKNAISVMYYDRSQAAEAARDYAARHPKVPVLLLAAVAVFEAKQPDTTQKEFRDNGELIPTRDEG